MDVFEMTATIKMLAVLPVEERDTMLASLRISTTDMPDKNVVQQLVCEALDEFAHSIADSLEVLWRKLDEAKRIEMETN